MVSNQIFLFSYEPDYNEKYLSKINTFLHVSDMNTIKLKKIIFYLYYI